MRGTVAQRSERLASSPPVPGNAETTKQLVTLWAEPKGIDSQSKPSRVGPAFAVDAINFMFEDRILRSRLGTKLLGNNAASQVLQTTDLLRANGKKVTIRFCLRHIEVFNYLTLTWRSFAVDLHGGEDDLFTWTSWADKLLFSNFVDGLWELDFQTYVIQKVPGAPGAKHLTVFGNRVVATAVNTASVFMPQRIQWSVKNNYLDWTGTGSGSEDMYGAPGGVVDEAQVTIPVTDEAAFVVRATSTWQMSVSGVAIAPFRFSRILRVGSPYRRSIAETPRGIVFVNTKSVYMIGVGIFQDIGQAIINRLNEAFSDCRGAYSVYDSTRDEYRIGQCYAVFRYRWDEGGWTQDRYPYTLKSLGIQLAGKTGYPIDSLPGIIDSLPGTIDSLVVDRYTDDKVYLVPDNEQVSIVEFEDVIAKDQLADGSFVDSPISIDSGVVNIDRLEASELLEGHFEYESDEVQTLVFDYLVGGSATSFSSKDLVATTNSEIKRLAFAQVSRKQQFRIRSSILGKLRILAFVIGAVRVHRAS